jgi:hypothetical protein
MKMSPLVEEMLRHMRTLARGESPRCPCCGEPSESFCIQMFGKTFEVMLVDPEEDDRVRLEVVDPQTN